MTENIGKLVVIAGPSGVGKGTVAKWIVSNYSNFIVSVSATTRAPRPGESEGTSYFFLSKSDFEEKVKNHQMLEWAVVHGDHMYGTPRLPVVEATRKGLNVILEIDVQGAFQVKKIHPEALLFFLKPPSFEELRSRLDARGTESEEQKQLRLQTAQMELELADKFDFVLVNDEVARCASQVVELTESK